MTETGATASDAPSTALGPKIESCACGSPPQRVCDLCYSADAVFLACSSECLSRHHRAQHATEAGKSSEARARAAASAWNRRFPDSWARYAPHRRHVMSLLADVPRGGSLCVLGAGNGNDIDLEELARTQREIHLVDLDGEGLERSRDRQTPHVRAKLRLHPGVDLSGLLAHLDDWGDQFPARTELGKSAVLAAQAILAQLGSRFSTVISTCVLSQLGAPFRRAWVTSRGNWGDLLSALHAVHLATLAGSVERGGRGLLVFDTSSSKDTPAIAEQSGLSARELAAFAEAEHARGALAFEPSPQIVVSQLRSPGLATLVSEPKVGLPWLWDLGDAMQLVYSVSFARPA